MSFTDRLVLWLHLAFAIFTIGPISAAIMSTPRYIRTRNVAIVRFLRRMVQIFGLISLGVLIFGIILGQQLDLLAKPWLTASMTLFVVSIALLVIIVRDQHRAITALEKAATEEALPPGAAGESAAASQPRQRPRRTRPVRRRPRRPGRRRRRGTSPPSSAAASPPWARWSP